MDLDYKEIMDCEELKDYEDFIHHFLPHLLSIQSNIVNNGLDCMNQEEENEILKYFNVSKKKQFLEFPAPKKLTTEKRCGISRQFLAHLLN